MRLPFFSNREQYITPAQLAEARNLLADQIAMQLAEFKSGGVIMSGTGQNAFRLGAVFASTRLLSNTIASMPVNVYRRTANGKELANDHPAYTLLNERPNLAMTGFTLQEIEVNNELMGGFALSQIIFDKGKPVALNPIPNSKVKKIYPGKTGLLYYDIEGLKKQLTGFDVIHHLGLTLDGINGMGVIEYARLSIENGRQAEQYGKDFFAKGTNPSIFLEHPGKLSAEAVKTLKKTWTETNTGPQNNHGVSVLWEGLKVQRLTVNPKDAQFIEGRAFTVVDIARWFGVPPHKIGDLEKTTIGNVEEQNIQFVTDTIRPMCEKREQEYDRKLFIGSDEGRYFVKYDLNALLRGNMAARATYYQTMVNIGAMAPNDVLQSEDKQPYEGGQYHYMQQGFARIEEWEKDNKLNESQP